MSLPPQTEPRGKSQQLRFVAVCLGAIWLSALIWLVGSSANPVTINRAQLRLAAQHGVILSGIVIDETSGRVRVIEVLSQDADTKEQVVPNAEISIGDLSRSGKCKAGRRYVFPLGRRGSAFAVVPTALPGEIPLIYPDTEDARHQIADVLEPLQKNAAG